MKEIGKYVEDSKVSKRVEKTKENEDKPYSRRQFHGRVNKTNRLKFDPQTKNNALHLLKAKFLYSNKTSSILLPAIDK